MADSPEFNLGDLDEDEEPLFADDIEDDDPPPLPPPMPSFSQLSQTTHSGAAAALSNSAENFGGGATTSPGGGAPAGSGDNEQEQAQKKRKPMLTLTVDRVFSEKGLPYLEKEFPKIHFQGKGHEESDLKLLLFQYEHWANALFPHLTCKDVTNRIEALAKKKEFKTELIQMRRRSAGTARGSRHPSNSDSDHAPEDGNPSTNPSSTGDDRGAANGDPFDDERRGNSSDSEEDGGLNLGRGNSSALRPRDSVTRTRDSDSEGEFGGEDQGPVNGSTVRDSRKRRARVDIGSSEEEETEQDHTPRPHNSNKRLRLGSHSSRDDCSPPNVGTTDTGGGNHEQQRTDGGSGGDDLEEDCAQTGGSATLAGRRLRLDSDSSEEDRSSIALVSGGGRRTTRVDSGSGEDECSPPDHSVIHSAGRPTQIDDTGDVEGQFDGQDSDSDHELQIDMNRDPEQDDDPAPSDEEN